MKTLDEVIDNFEKACDLERRCEDCSGCLYQENGCPNDGAESVPDLQDEAMSTTEKPERDCNKCLWATRDCGCASWDCKFVNKQDAYDAWKEQQRPRRDRLIEVLQEVRGEK